MTKQPDKSKKIVCKEMLCPKNCVSKSVGSENFWVKINCVKIKFWIQNDFGLKM